MTLAQATKKLMITNPFYGFVLMSLNKRFSDICSTACVAVSGINYELLVNEDYWDSISEENQLATLKHELLHICLFHIEMHKDFSNKKVFNIASDMAVNSFIDRIEDDDFVRAEDYGFPPEMGAKWYYNKLMEGAKSQSSGGSNESTGSQDGTPNGTKEITNHNTWKVVEGMSDSQKQLLHNQVDYMIKNAAESVIKSRGSLPGEMQEYIKNLLKPHPPVFNWRSYLRRLVGMAEKYYLKISRKKPSKRFEGAAGLKHKHLQNLMVAIDTSGSVDTQELAEFYAEIKHIARAGANIDIVECDAGIAATYPFKKWDGGVHGREGTSFKPVFDLFNGRSKKEYSALIYFTDGRAPIDGLKSSKPVIWVITSNGERQNYPGKVCYIPNRNNDE